MKITSNFRVKIVLYPPPPCLNGDEWKEQQIDFLHLHLKKIHNGVSDFPKKGDNIKRLIISENRNMSNLQSFPQLLR